jgi:hypothetical protein
MSAVIYGVDAFHRAIARRSARQHALWLVEQERRRAQERSRSSLDRILGPADPTWGGAA